MTVSLSVVSTTRMPNCLVELHGSRTPEDMDTGYRLTRTPRTRRDIRSAAPGTRRSGPADAAAAASAAASTASRNRPLPRPAPAPISNGCTPAYCIHCPARGAASVHCTAACPTAPHVTHPGRSVVALDVENAFNAVLRPAVVGALPTGVAGRAFVGTPYAEATPMVVTGGGLAKSMERGG